MLHPIGVGQDEHSTTPKRPFQSAVSTVEVNENALSNLQVWKHWSESSVWCWT